MSRSNKPTLLDFAILGLIREEPQTGYEIRKAFETTALGNYSSSPGTIYPALKRLQKLELVEKTTEGKVRVQITRKGMEILRGWLLLPVEKKDIEKSVDELLLRYAFMDPQVSREQQIRFLISLRDLLHPYVAELQHYLQQEYDQLPLSGRLAFEHGIMSYEATLQWCEKAIKELTKNIE